MNQDKQKFFFEQYGLNEADLERYLGAALGAGGDYADLYFEYLTTTSITLDESMVKSASQGISAGCGVRVISGERTGYAYTDDLAPEKILRAARTAALIASGPAKQPVVNLKEHGQQNLYPVNTFSVDADISAKLALVQRADAAARANDARIFQVRANYGEELRRILVIGSDGTFASDFQPLARMNVFCIARQNGTSARGSSGGGGRVALDFFHTEKTPEHFAHEAARQAIVQLDAREAPAGEMGAHPHAAHDQHLHAGRHGRARRHYPQREARRVCGELWRRAGGHHQRKICLLGQRGLPDRRWADHRAAAQCHAHRQRAR